MSADKLLREAMGEMDKVLILGFNLNGDIRISSADLTTAELCLLVDFFKHKLLNGNFNTLDNSTN